MALFLALAATAQAQLLYGISQNNLISFQANAPCTIISTTSITGIEAGFDIAGLDFRPLTGELYLLAYRTSSGEARLYTLNVNSGVANQVGSQFMLGMNMGQIGFDFNPTVDRIRITGANGFNFRIHPLTGVIAATDTNLSFAMGDENFGVTPNIGSVAYTNSYLASSGTVLFNFDQSMGVLTMQDPPNTGTLNTIGVTGVHPNIADLTSDLDIFFDPATRTNRAFLVANTGTSNFDSLYSIDLTTGLATQVCLIGGGMPIQHIAAFVSGPSTTPVSGKIVYALTANGDLIWFDSNNPSSLRGFLPVTGILAGQKLCWIDFRPATGELYGLAYNPATGEARMYLINKSSGVATPVGSSNFIVGINVGRIGFDFNPMADRIRLTTSSGMNLRLHPTTGQIAATDNNLSFGVGDPNQGATPNISAVAYSNSFLGAGSTQLFGFDDVLNTFVIQNPNAGTLTTLGTAGININNADLSADFDITFDSLTRSNIALFTGNPNSENFDSLYTINLNTGQLTPIGSIGLGVPIKSLAVEINRFVPTTVTGRLVYGVTLNNELVTVDANHPGIIRSLMPITGLEAGQVICGLDVRPSTNELYALGYNKTTGDVRIYKLDPNTAVATPVGAAAVNVGLNLGAIGFDFNPMADLIRITGANGVNLRINPTTGAIAGTDTNLAFGAGDVNFGTTPGIGAVAYSNSFSGAGSTTLFNIDQNLNILTRQDPPNVGTLATIGSLGIQLDTSDRTFDFDIAYNPATQQNQGFLLANRMGSEFDELFSINLTTGATTPLGFLGLAVPLKNIAIAGLVVQPPGVDLELTMTASVSNYTQYVDVTYTITVTNKGASTATGVTVAAGLPDGFVHTSNSVTKGSYNLFFERWDVGTLAPGESATLTLVLFPLVKNPSVANYAQVMTQNESDFDSTPGNDSDNSANEDDEASVTVLGPPAPPQGGTNADLGLFAKAENNLFDLYKNVTYELILVNRGPDAASGITVRAGLPQGFVHTSHATQDGEYNLFFQRWDVGFLAAGDTARLDLTLFPLVSTNLVNNFFQVLSSDQTDPNSTPGNDTDNTANEDDEAMVSISPNPFGNGNSPEDLMAFDGEKVMETAIFPVPSSVAVQVQVVSLVEMERAEIRVFDHTGRQVQHQETSMQLGFNEWTLDISGLANGSYFVQVPGVDKVLRFLKM